MALLVTFAKEPTFVVSPNLMYPHLKYILCQAKWVVSAASCRRLPSTSQKALPLQEKERQQGRRARCRRKGCYA